MNSLLLLVLRVAWLSILDRRGSIRCYREASLREHKKVATFWLWLISIHPIEQERKVAVEGDCARYLLHLFHVFRFDPLFILLSSLYLPLLAVPRWWPFFFFPFFFSFSADESITRRSRFIHDA